MFAGQTPRGIIEHIHSWYIIIQEQIVDQGFLPAFVVEYG